MRRLDGKVAIVTGASRGLGRAIAVRFAAEGAQVALVVRGRQAGDRVADEIRAAGGVARCVLCDVGQTERIAGAVAEVVETFGTIDILVNNAFDDSTSRASVLEATPALIASQMNSAFIASLTFMQACHPFLARRGGRVINMGSASGVVGHPGYLPYAVAKEAIRTLTRMAAREWGPQKITVNALCPIALTDAMRASLDEDAPAALPQMALRTMGTPEDVAPVALFLAGDDSAYLTGYTLNADGGFLIDAAR